MPKRATVDLRPHILARLQKLPIGTTMCPGKLARDCGTVLAEIRDDLLALASAGKIQVTQRGRTADLRDLKGPFRVSRPATSPSKGVQE